jgi:hypothetical protein
MHVGQTDRDTIYCYEEMAHVWQMQIDYQGFTTQILFSDAIYSNIVPFDHFQELILSKQLYSAGQAQDIWQVPDNQPA